MWEKRLVDFIEARRNMSFEWGVNDCCEFSKQAEITVSGQSSFSQYTNGYKDRKSAWLYLKKIGFNDVWELCDAHLPPIPVSLTQRGDLVGHKSGDGCSMGVCLGDKFAALGDNGLEFISMKQAIKAWRIERG